MGRRPGSDARGALPNLLIIGAGRCGTTSLHHYLDQHPEIVMSRPKELRFFAADGDPDAEPALHDPADRRIVSGSRGAWSRGLEWYTPHFDPSAPVRGESSPVYSSPWYPGCPERIAEVVPDARLLLCVRDPVRRAISHYRMARGYGWEQRPIDEALGDPDGFYAGRGLYGLTLSRYLRVFSAGQIEVIEADELARDRRETLRRTFAFLGVDPDYWSDRLDQRWNALPPQATPLWRLYARVRKLPLWPRLATLPPRASLRILDRALSRSSGPADTQEPSPEVQARLRESLGRDTALLRELTGRRFAGWSV